MDGSNLEKENKGRTVFDAVVGQRIARLMLEATESAVSKDEVNDALFIPQHFAETIREEASAELGEIAKYQLATEASVKIGDLALFRIPAGFVFGQIKSTSPIFVHGTNCGIRLDETIVLTKDGKVLLGRNLAEQSFHSRVPSNP